MNTTKLIILLLVLTFMFSCKEEEHINSKIIEIDIKEEKGKKLPKLTIESIIPLETKVASLFGNLVSVEYFSDRFYGLDVFSSKALFVFSREGDYINKTKLGKGPDEIINPFAFFVDRVNHNVLVWDQTLSTIYTYDLDLNFLSKNKMDIIPFLEFAKVNENDMLIRSHFHQDYAFTLYSPDYKSKKQFIQDYKYSGSQGLSRSITTRGKHNYLISSFDYNIYELVGDKIQSKYYFDFGKYKIEKEDIRKNGMSGNWNLIREGRKVSSPNEIDESDNFILFHVFYKRNPVHYLYSENTDVIYRLNDYFEDGILPKCEIRGVVKNDVFYALVSPEDLIKFQKKSNHKLINHKIGLEENPYIITFSILEEDK